MFLFNYIKSTNINIDRRTANIFTVITINDKGSVLRDQYVGHSRVNNILMISFYQVICTKIEPQDIHI